MFYFFHPTQTVDNARYYKGILFESLLKVYLKRMGYRVNVTRTKNRSLEYDIQGVHEVDERMVIGEAKAHEATIPGHDIAAFVGKCLPIYYENNKLSALFLSTNALSPEAGDFIRGLTGKNQFPVNCLCGQDLQDRVREALALPNGDFAKQQLSRPVPFISAEHILQTDTGTFLIVCGCGEAGAFTDRFAVLRSDGAVVNDSLFLEGLRKTIQPLQSLEPAVLEVAPSLPPTRSRVIPSGLLTGSEWTDYRRPAAPQFFVGRKTEMDRVSEIISASREGAIVELKSRSGVGKSSILTMLAEKWKNDGHRVEIHDSRDVQSAMDVLYLVNRLIGSAATVKTVEAIPIGLQAIQQQMGEKRAVFIVDQFESTFQKPEVFTAYEYLAVSIARCSSKISMVFARKDDLLTTHDELAVDLERLRSLAVPVSLDDFDKPQAAELVRRIADSHPNKLDSSLLSSVLQFAQGFPWLLKRTMAHVLSVLARGVSQRELVSAGLELEDLFEEELSGLDEMERGYLRRLATSLPATYHYLLQRYERDPLLPRMLENLRERKLLRLSAGIYDTYNDVFKEFLLYNRLPENSQDYMFRLGPVPVMSTFRQLGGRNTIVPEELGQQLGTSLGGAYNLLRELRIVGLVTRANSDWIIPTVVRQYEHQGRLAEYVRQSLMKNVVVADFLTRLERKVAMTEEEVEIFLREHFSFVEAKDNVWKNYRRTFLSWLKHLKFVGVDAGGLISLVTLDREAIAQTLGNLVIRGRGMRDKDTPFLPMRRLTVYLRVLERLGQKVADMSSLSSTEQETIRSLIEIGAAEMVSRGQARGIWTPERLTGWATAQFDRVPYSDFWIAVKERYPYEQAMATAFGLEHLAPATRTSLGIMLVNWGKDLGLLPKKRFIKTEKGGGVDPAQGLLFHTASQMTIKSREE